jgi:hypothetical protein
VAGQAAPLTAAAPHTLWINNNPLAKTVWEDPPHEEVRNAGMGLAATKQAEHTPPQAHSPGLDAYRSYHHSVPAYVRANPGRYLVLSLSRALFLWNLWPTPPPSLKVFAAFWAVLAFAVLGMALTWRQTPLTALLFLLVFCYTFVHAATYAIPRYRMPAMPWVMLLAAAGLVGIVTGLMRRGAAAPEIAAGLTEPEGRTKS